MKRSLLLVLGVVSACAPDLRDDHPFDGTLVAGNYLEHEPQSDGTTLSTVDATNKQSFVYVDLDSASVVGVGDGWDLSFQRFKISSNGGSSGLGSVRVAVVKDGGFAAMTEPPAEGFVQDGNETVFNGVEGGWYVYDLGKHKLITREDLFYVVHTDAAFFKLKMRSYYDTAGTAARMQFWWAKLQPR